MLPENAVLELALAGGIGALVYFDQKHRREAEKLRVELAVERLVAAHARAARAAPVRPSETMTAPGAKPSLASSVAPASAPPAPTPAAAPLR